MTTRTEAGVDTPGEVRHPLARMFNQVTAVYFAFFGFFAPKSPGGRTCA